MVPSGAHLGVEIYLFVPWHSSWICSAFSHCLTNLHRERCQILAQCETIPDISFDLAQIWEGAGLGYADDLLDSAFAASKIVSLRSIEQVNPGFLDSVKAVFEVETTACHDLAFSLPARQLASSLLTVDPTFLQDDHQGQDYSGLCELQQRLSKPNFVQTMSTTPSIRVGRASKRGHSWTRSRLRP